MFDDASLVEELWTAASIIALLIHLYLSFQALIDWKLVSRYDEHWRGISAGWYFLGQTCLFLPKIVDLTLGVLAMTLPEPRNAEIREVQIWAQTAMIVAEWVGALGAIAFWMARRAIRNFVDEQKLRR